MDSRSGAVLSGGGTTVRGAAAPGVPARFLSGS